MESKFVHKYNYGDIVYISYRGSILQMTVNGIEYSKKYSKNGLTRYTEHVNYLLHTDILLDITYGEEYVYSSIEELIVKDTEYISNKVSQITAT